MMKMNDKDKDEDEDEAAGCEWQRIKARYELCGDGRKCKALIWAHKSEGGPQCDLRGRE